MSKVEAPFNMASQLSVRQLSPTTFESTHLPKSMGNNQPIAYGGCAIGLAVHAATLTVPPTHHIYSVLGAFHGPTRTDLQLQLSVTTTRSTKTFQTRRVVASQTLPSGSRTCLDIFVDFHVREEAMYEYSAPPVLKSSPHDDTSAPTDEIARGLVSRGLVDEKLVAGHKLAFSLTTAFENRQVRDSVTGQNLKGLAKGVETSQDALPIHEKTSGEWYRLNEALGDAEHVACLAFIMDAALSFLPLNHDHKNLADVGACSTLDFALRYLRPNIRMDEWHVVERRTIGAGVGRTYSETRMWDEHGTLVAVNNQTCIARPLKEAAKL